jgi:hypothetical protein
MDKFQYMRDKMSFYTTTVSSSSVRKIETKTLTAPATRVTFSGLNLEGVNAYKLFATFKGVDNGPSLRVEFNGDTTAANYRTEKMQAADSGVSASRANNNTIGGMLSNAGNTALLEATFKKSIGVNAICLSSFANGDYDAPSTDISSLYWTTTANVTSISLYVDVADQLGVGTTMTLYSYV